MAEALRIGDTMSAHAHVDVDKPGRDDDFNFDMQILRDADGRSTRTVLEMREAGDTQSIVSELVETPGEALTSWYWDIQKRRWIRIRGLQGTDPFADTTFRYEDLWFTEPSPRRNGRAKWVDEGGRRLVEIESDPVSLLPTRGDAHRPRERAAGVRCASSTTRACRSASSTTRRSRWRRPRRSRASCGCAISPPAPRRRSPSATCASIVAFRRRSSTSR